MFVASEHNTFLDVFVERVQVPNPNSLITGTRVDFNFLLLFILSVGFIKVICCDNNHFEDDVVVADHLQRRNHSEVVAEGSHVAVVELHRVEVERVFQDLVILH